MHLSKLEIFGFKSFAQKLDLEFGEGITAVVGPNGCGKTNVVDAIRWVLGEQKPSVLRSGRMEDVIFCGSPTRRPLGMAEVSLTIENTKNILPIEFSEVTVTRRLFRSGESDYLLNKIPCRLMDINNLFMDTGIGPHAYSVIEQDMVEIILSDRAEDRRSLFEEAAGITKYKIRRRSAWSKLQSIQQDLLRVDDIIGEVERQVRSLRQQVGRARRYQEYSEKLQKLEILLGQYQFLELRDQARPLMEEMERRKREAYEDDVLISSKEAQLEKLRLNLLEAERDLSEAAEAANRGNEEIHRKNEEIVVARERLKSLDLSSDRAAQEERETRRRLSAAERQRDEAQEEIERSRLRMADLKEKLRAGETGLTDIERQFEERQDHLNAEKEKFVNLFRLHSDLSGKLAHTQAERDGLISRMEGLEEEKKEVEVELEIAQKSVEMALAEIGQAEKQVEQLIQKREALSDHMGQVEQRLKGLQEEKVKAMGVLEAGRAKLGLMERMRRSYEGYSQSVQSLMLGSPYSEQIRGTLADLIDVDARYMRAIEAALDGSLECLVIDQVQVAVEAIQFLKNQAGGRAAFYPLERIGENCSASQSVPVGGSVVGKAIDLIRSDENTLPLFRLLLEDTFVVEDLEAALALSRTEEGEMLRLVTLDGEVIAPTGKIAGGSREEDQGGLLGRGRQIEALEGEVGDAVGRMNRLTVQIEQDETAIQELTASLSETDRRIAEWTKGQSKFERERDYGLSESNRCRSRLEAIYETLQKLKGRIAELDRSIDQQQQGVTEVESERAEIEAFLKEREEALAALDRERRSELEQVNRQRVEVASLKEKLISLRREIDRSEHMKKTFGEKLKALRKEIAEAQVMRKEWREKKEQGEGVLQSLYELQTEREKKRDFLQARHQEIAEMSRVLEDEIKEVRKRQNEYRDRLHSLEVQLSELRSKAEVLRERMRQDYKVDVEELGSPPMDGLNSSMTERSIEELRERMRRLGPVNLAALQEYEIQKERYEFLTRQRDDLLEGEETLKKTLATIDRTARRQFLDTFEEIRNNFRETFIRFFEGGEADLNLEENADPLEADIRITARPKGKRLHHINLLSGGERALTAIALLFAIYQVKPSPFCLLDEVDAALDDANIGRFGKVIRQFSKGTQFIVVTHNKRTMAAADCLYGVTMEEPGVSKLVSVRLERSKEEMITEYMPEVGTVETEEALAPA